MDASEITSFFDHVSTEWDEMRSDFYNDAFIDALALHTHTDSSMTLLDIGTGTGFVATGLTPRVGSVANMVLHHTPEPAAMVSEMARVTRPVGWVAITDAVQHSHEWMRVEQADIWLGFTEAEVAGFFADARLVEYGYATLGMQ